MSATRGRITSPLFIDGLSQYALLDAYSSLGGGTLSSYTWSSANNAQFIPICLPFSFVVTQLWWANGGVVSGNVDCGIYYPNGTRIVSTGATAQSGTTSIQMVDIPDTTLSPGNYLMALSLNNSTGTIYGSASVTSQIYQRIMCIRNASSSHPLPASTSFGGTGSNVFLGFGITGRTLSGTP